MHPLDQFNKIMQALEEIKQALAEQNKYRFTDQYLDNDELMAVLKVSKRTTQTWRENGTIPYARLGKKIYYRLSDLQSLFENEFKKEKKRKVKSPFQTKRKAAKNTQKLKGWTINV